MKSSKTWTGMLLAVVGVACGALAALAGPKTVATRGMQKLVFNANGGTCKTGYDYYTQGEPYTFLPEAVWNGHEFLGWFTAASGGVQVTEAQTVTTASTRTLYAHWTPDSASSTMQKLIFNANGGTCNTGYDWYTVGQPYAFLPEAQRNGYELVGWFTAASGGVQVTEAQTVTSAAERTLYAHWTATSGVTMQKLVFNANGGTCNTGYDWYTVGQPYAYLPEAQRNGYELVGWFTAASGGVQVTEAQTVTSAAERTLYAHWTPVSGTPTMQKLVFNANGGTCNTPWDWYTVGQPYAYLPEANRSGYVLAGWFTSASGGMQVTESQTVTAVAERTLYAHWTSSAVERTWRYTLSNGQAEVTGASPSDGNLAIPAFLGGYPVTGIGSSAFISCGGLTSVTLPNTVTNVEWDAFYGCSGLKSFAVAADNPAYSSKDGILFTKDGKTLLRCPGGKTGTYSVPAGVTGIGYYAFLDCEGLTSVKIPSGVTNIDDSAFFECTSLASVTIPHGVANIGNYVFYLCRGLKSVTLPDSVTRIGDSAFHECNSLAGLTIPGRVASIGSYAFEGCSGLASLTLPPSVASIGYCAFDGCSSLKTLYVPASWKGTSMLAGTAFPAGCKVVYASLALGASKRTFTAAAASSKELEVTANVAWTVTSSVSWLALRTEGGSGNGTIVYDVAANTGTASRTGKITVAGGGLTRTFTVTQSGFVATLQLGASERTFTADAANGKLLEVTATVSWTATSSVSWLTVRTASGSGNGNIEYAVAANTGTGSRTGTITVSGGGLARTFTVTQGGKTAQGGTAVVGGVTWSYSVANGKATVTGANPATGSLAIPSTLGGYPVTTIGASTPDGDGAFEGSTGLTSVTIPSGVTCIGYRAFDYCPNLASVKIPSSVTVIRTEAFDGCAKLASVTIPGNATSIDTEAFDGCSGLRSITVGAGSPAYSSKDGVLFSKDGKVLLLFPGGKTGNYSVPAGVTDIAAGAFYGAGGLASVAIPASVGDIGYSAFSGCSSLKTLYIPESWKSKYVENYWGGTTFWSTYAEVPSGCKVVYGTPQLTLAASERTFTAAAASSKELEVIADVPWTAKASVSWLTVKKGSGTGNGTLVYNVAANAGATRTGTITVSGGGLSRKFTVTQSGIAVTLALEAASRTFTAAAASGKLLAVTANVSWTAKASASWLTVKTTGGSGSGNIEYAVAANTGTASRTATITVAGGGLSRSFTVTQGGKTDGGGTAATLSLKSSSRSFTADAASGKEMSVMANVSWTAKSSASWLTLKTAKGSGNGKVVYNVAANTGTASRTATITVAGGGLSRTFTVTQSGKTGGGGTAATLSLKSSSRSFTADAASGKEMSVMANVSWTAKSSASWLVLKTAKGSGNGKVVYNVAANTGTATRSATITVSGGGLTRTFTVIQSGKARSARAKAAKPQIWATTSDGSDGGAVADGDESTGWSPSGADGAWVALTFGEERDVGAVEVVGERLPEGMRVLVSEDGDHWSEEGGEAVSYLWVLLPGEGEVPTIREIATEP